MKRTKRTKRILSIVLTMAMIFGVFGGTTRSKAASLTPVGEVKLDGTVTITHPGNGPVILESSTPAGYDFDGYSYAILTFTTASGNNGYFFDVKNNNENEAHNGCKIVRELSERYSHYDGYPDDPNCWDAGDAVLYQASTACEEKCKSGAADEDFTINKNQILRPNTTYYLLVNGKAGDRISVTVKKIPMKVSKPKIKTTFTKKTLKKKKVDRAGYYRLKIVPESRMSYPRVYWKIKSCPKNGKEYILDGSEPTLNLKEYNDSLKLKNGLPKGTYKITLYTKGGFCPRWFDADWKELKNGVGNICYWMHDYYFKASKTIQFKIK